MIVDDEEDVTFCLSLVLQETGQFEVDGFTDPQQALSSFKPETYDLVILDIKNAQYIRFSIYPEYQTGGIITIVAMVLFSPLHFLSTQT
jgi:DNA-binding response OmpR family regulator